MVLVFSTLLWNYLIITLINSGVVCVILSPSSMLSDEFCLSREKSPSKLFWKISYRSFRMLQTKPSQLLHLVKVMPLTFLLWHSLGINTSKLSLNLVLWIYLFIPFATRTCSYIILRCFSIKTGEVSDVLTVSSMKQITLDKPSPEIGSN